MILLHIVEIVAKVRLSIILPTAVFETNCPSRRFIYGSVFCYICAMNSIILKRRIGNRVENGHPWIFGNEIDQTEEQLQPGGIVSVFTRDKKFIGKGYFNPRSQIAVRLLTRMKRRRSTIDSFIIALKPPGTTEKKSAIRKIAGWFLAKRMDFPA